MLRNNIYLIIIFLVTNNVIYVNSQTLSTKSKKAINYYDLAMQNMNYQDYSNAIEMLKAAVQADPKFTEAWLLMADAYEYLKEYTKMADACQKALDVGADKYPVTYFFSAQAFFKIGKYSEAIEKANIFLNKKQYTPDQKKESEKIIRNSTFALNALANPVPYNPINIGDSINTENDEYWPSISADENTIVFTRLIPKIKTDMLTLYKYQEDIFISKKKNDKWTLAKEIGSSINTSQNEGSECITSDGRFMYFTACNRPDGKGKCDIYVSEYTTNGWLPAENIGSPINTEFNEKQPSLSADGRLLFFVSNRPGSKGNYDIWVSQLDENNKWTEPVNLGDSINTEDDEQSPFIHPDKHTLYFSSNGWTSMGGYDVFVSYMKNNSLTSWTKPKNLGYPINTNSDEIGFSVNAKGNMAFFSSNRISEKGKDIYQFELYPDVRPISVTYMKGKVYDSETNNAISAKFELIDLDNNQLYLDYSSNTNGEFLVCIPINNQFALNVSHPEYMFYSEHFQLSEDSFKTIPYIKNIALKPIKKGNAIVLENIFFETGSYELKKESQAELNKLIQFLNNNKNIKIEIGGHTDNTGTKEGNKQLSEKRAYVVARYLIDAGIDINRITYKGYGDTQPIDDNTTAQGRSKNRRTEFRIIE